MTAPRILFKGYYNLYNLGDDLLLLSLLEFFNSYMGWLPEATTFYVEPGEGSFQKLGYSVPYKLNIYNDPIKLRHLQLQKKKWPSVISKCLMGVYILGCLFSALFYRVTGLSLGNRGNISFFKNIDIIHYIGGGYFNTRLTWGTQLLVYELLFIIMGKIINPKLNVIGTGLGIGPVSTKFYKLLFKKFIQNFEFVFVREKESENFVKSLGVAKHVQCVGDDVVLLLPYFQKIARTTPKLDRFGFNLKFDDVHQHQDSRYFFENLIWNCQASGHEVVFFNFGRDHHALRQLPQKLVEDLPIYSCYEDGLETFSQHLAASKNGLGFAYHFLILCTLMNIPSINIYFDDYYRQKTNGVMQLLCNSHVTIPYYYLNQKTPKSLLKELEMTDQAHVETMFHQLVKEYRRAYQLLETISERDCFASSKRAELNSI